jgi:hypothetical protein
VYEQETVAMPRSEAHTEALGPCLYCRPELNATYGKKSYCRRCESEYDCSLAKHLRVYCDGV